MEKHDPYEALREPNFRNFLIGNAFSLIGTQMFNVAVGWELYQRTNSATALGLVGLFQVVPFLICAVPAGQLADRYDRKKIIIVDQILLSLMAAAMATSSLIAGSWAPSNLANRANSVFTSIAHALGEESAVFEGNHIPLLFVLLVVNGLLRSVNQPAKQAVLPQLMPERAFPNAVTWNSSVFETCTVLGPTLGGAVIAVVLNMRPESPWAYPIVYYLNALAQTGQLLFFLPIKLPQADRRKEPLSLRSMFAGLRFVFVNRPILAAASLDLFAVLFGGAVALLPVIARDVLHVGPLGLGALRSAPSIGAVCMAVTTAHRGPMRKAGISLLAAVAGFGAATIAFGLSRSFYFSFLMLLVVGACDNVSVIVRQTLVQLLTPNEMRGRVTAVNSVFIACSNELGALESGLAAAFFTGVAGSAAQGAQLSVIAGGAATLVVVVVIGRIFPELFKLGALSELGKKH